MSLFVNDKKVGEGRMEHTQALTLGLGGTLDIGEDTGSAVDESYTPPFRFGGTIKQGDGGPETKPPTKIVP